MLSEDFDKKIREAADHHHPAYDERAWKEMKKKLDKHLPVKGEKRRRFLFWWLLPFLLGGAVLMLFRPWEKEKDELVAATERVDQPGQKAVQDKIATKEKDPKETDGTVTAPVKAGAETTGEKNKQIIEPPVAEKASNPDKIIVVAKEKSTVPLPNKTSVNTNKQGGNPTKTRQQGRKDQLVSVQPKLIKPAVTDKKDETPVNTDAAVPTGTEPGTREPAPEMANRNITAPQDIKTATGTEGDRSTAPTAQPPVTATNTVANAASTTQADKKQEETVTRGKEKTKPKSKATSSFFVGLSGGADVSFVSGNKTGTLKPVTGIGLGYTFRNKFTVRTGFYTARKVYTADGDSYKPSAAFSQYYPYLVNVDANCKVYEIPVSVAYHFGKKTHSNWFVSAGLSTLLMKSEWYNYDYKYTPTGNIYSRDWSIRNENKHYFSVATLSAGYSRSLGKRFLFMAEPYLKLPLAGVGFGKVKLNSGGVLFTVGYRPFGK